MRPAHFVERHGLLVIVAAAGIHGAIAHPGDPAAWLSAFALGGIALFLLGVAATRRSLAIGSHLQPIVAAVLVLATNPIATIASTGLHLVAVLGVVVVMLTLEARRFVAKTVTERV